MFLKSVTKTNLDPPPSVTNVTLFFLKASLIRVIYIFNCESSSSTSYQINVSVCLCVCAICEIPFWKLIAISQSEHSLRLSLYKFFTARWLRQKIYSSLSSNSEVWGNIVLIIARYISWLNLSLSKTGWWMIIIFIIIWAAKGAVTDQELSPQVSDGAAQWLSCSAVKRVEEEEKFSTLWFIFFWKK